MILHIFKKDVRLLWHFAVGVTIAGWLAMSLAPQSISGPAFIQQMFAVLTAVKIFATIFLIASVVHTDAVPGVRQDWLTRPIARRDLILAKILFVLVVVVVPGLLADIVQLVTTGFPLSQALRAGLIRGVCLLAIFYLPVMGVASLTRNFTETVVASVIAIIGSLLFSLAPSPIDGVNWRSSLFAPTGAEWVSEFSVALIAALAGGFVLVLQYAKRRTLFARFIAAGASVLCLLAASALPWKPVFAFQRKLSPQPGGASAVQLTFDRNREHFRGLSDYTEPNREIQAVVNLPICMSGIGADSILRTDLLQVRLTTPEGKREELGIGRVPLEMREGPARPQAPCPYTSIFVPAKLYASLHDRPVRIDLDYSLTLLRLQAAHAMPALNGEQRIAEFGRCRTRVNDAGNAIALQCEQAAMTPPCATVFLEHPASRTRNPEVVICAGAYAPFNTQMEPDTLRRLSVGLPFRDTAGSWHPPVAETMLRDSQVVTRWYDSVEHFSREVAISDVRLSQWAGQ